MTWQITWALILGFGLSAMIQALVRKSTIIRLLGDDRPRTLTLAAGFGAASSSCSYAAVALARALFRQGASFTSAMVFEIASTNLVAVHPGRVRRRAYHDRPHRRGVPALPPTAVDRRGTGPERVGAGRLDG